MSVTTAAAPRRFRFTAGHAGIALLTIITLIAAAAPLLAPYDPRGLTGAPFLPPGSAHLLGTDDIGHDILSVLLHGARVSLVLGILTACIAIGAGAIAGINAGFLGGAVDMVVMRVVDIVLVLPTLPLLLVVGAFLGPGIGTEIAVISAAMWARPARELRAQVLALRGAGHVQASIAMGGGRAHVMFRHVLPGVVPVLVPQFVEAAKNAILAEASLSFLGLGDPTVMSWGTLLYHANARGALLTGAWLWWGLPPGLCLGLTVLALALTGFAVEEIVKPSLVQSAGRAPARARRPASDAHARPPDAGQLPPSRDVAALDDSLLRVDGLTIEYETAGATIAAVRDVRLAIRRGEILALVGESGSGKSTLASALMRLLPGTATTTAGSVTFDRNDVLALAPEAMRALRGNRIALVPQSAMSSLDPVVRVGRQMVEAMRVHRPLGRAPAERETARLLGEVDLAPGLAHAFPHELSGGMRQRVVIAMALANAPSLIIADEPTSGLDVIAQVELLRLLRRLSRDHGASLLLITHDIAAALGAADQVAVMHGGRIIERGPASVVAARPTADYTRRLLDSVPRLEDPAEAPPCAADPGEPLLRIDALRKSYPAPGGGLRAVLDGVDLTVEASGITGLVGRSGSGKTTIARILFGLERADAGSIRFDGRELTRAGCAHRARVRRQLHFVFQDAYDALPPQWRVRDSVAEPLRIRGDLDRWEVRARVRDALTAVSLVPAEAFLARYPHELSGGERQRVALARALVAEPRLVVADEPTSLLDAPLRAELLVLMQRLRREYGIAWLYITHDLALARALCDRLAILADGRIVEEGAASAVVAQPRHPRAAELVRAARTIGSIV